MNDLSRNLKVFIQEDDGRQRVKIEEDLKGKNYNIFFLPKDESVFELLKYHPDIVIQDYYTNKMINVHEWAVPI